MKKLLTMQETAAVLGFSEKNGHRAVQRYIKAGKLPCVKLGRNVRLKGSVLMTFIDGHVKPQECIYTADYHLPNHQHRAVWRLV